MLRQKLPLDSDMLVVLVMSIAQLLCIALIPDSPVRIVLGLPFVLFFPGYMLLCVLFPQKSDITNLERLALSIGLSLAITPLIALALNYTPMGIQMSSIVTSLFGFTIAMTILTYYRRTKLSQDQKFTSLINIKMPKLKSLNTFDKLSIIGFFVAVLSIAMLTGYLASQPKIYQQYTEFYVLDSNGQPPQNPLNLTAAENATIILGITNHEYENVTYKITLTLNGTIIETISNITLSNQMTWQQNYVFAALQTHDRLDLEITLYREGVADPYRSLQLWLTVQPTP